MHPSRFNCLTQTIQGIIQAGSPQIPKIARFFSGPAQPDSVVTRIERLLDDDNFDPIHTARSIAEMLNLSQISKWSLVIDRTNWKYGQKHNNLLVLGVIYKKSFVPLLVDNLGDENKSGNSNLENRKCILEKFRQAFPNQKIKYLVGDREFIGKHWIKYLNDKNIPYVLRIKENWDVFYDESNMRTIPIKNFIKDKMDGKSVQCIKDIKLGAKGEVMTNLTVFPVKNRDGEKDVGIVMHSSCIKNAHLEYKKRWAIESAFKHMKTGGLNLEDSHLRKENRLQAMLQIIFLAISWIFLSARIFSSIDTKQNSINGLSHFRCGLEKLIRNIISRNFHSSNGFP